MDNKKLRKRNYALKVIKAGVKVTKKVFQKV